MVASSTVARTTPLIRGTVDGVPVTWLADTGSDVTFVTSNCPAVRRRAFRPLVHLASAPVTIDGTPLKVRGTVDATVVCGHLPARRHTLLIVDSVNTDCVLGNDFLSLYGEVALDFVHMTMRLTDNSMTDRRASSSDGETGVGPAQSSGLAAAAGSRCAGTGAPVRPAAAGPPAAERDDGFPVELTADVTIPAASEVLLVGRVRAGSSCAPGQHVSLVEDGKFTQRYGDSLCVSNSLDVVRADNVIQLRMCNPGQSETKLYKSCTVARCVAYVDPPAVRASPLSELSREEREARDRRLADIVSGKIAEADITDEQRRALAAMLLRRGDAFSVLGEIGMCDLVKHRIRLNDERQPPIRIPPRRTDWETRAKTEEFCDDLLRKGLIRKSHSPWSAPVVMCKKKDGSSRLTIDYRGLNKVTEFDAHPLVRIDDALDCLQNNSFFTTLDLASGYWQFKMDERDIEKTAFSTHSGHYEWLRMPMGQKNSGATLQMALQMLLADSNWLYTLSYVDDVILWSRDFDTHLKRLDEILGKFADASLLLKLEKCSFAQREVRYLGYLVTQHGIRPDPAKLKAVSDYPTPAAHEELQRFIGLTSYYRRFCHKYADIAKPLLKLLERKADRSFKNAFRWTTECDSAFKRLRDMLVTAPVLAYPKMDDNFELTTDASEVGISAILSQSGRPVAFASRVLTKAERNYSTTEKECLGLVWAVEHYRVYIYGRRCVLRTDHNPLLALSSSNKLKGRLARWALKLSEFELDIEHVAGKSIPHADALSRAPVGAVRLTDTSLVTPEEQERDETLRCVKDGIVTGRLTPAATEGARQLWRRRGTLRIEAGLLINRHKVRGRSRDQVVVPAHLVPAVLRLAHDEPMAGHQGGSRTLHRVKSRFFWNTMIADVFDWCRSCQACLHVKHPDRRDKAPHQQLPVPLRPWDFVSIDICGPFSPSQKGNKYILVVTDQATKWTEAFPMQRQDAESVCKILMDEIICRFGAMRQLHSDQGRQFESEVFRMLCARFGINKSRTSPHHPQGNPQAERFMRTLGNMLRSYVSENHAEWDERLPEVMAAYRTSVHDTTGQTPHMMLLGYEATTPTELAAGRTLEDSQMGSRLHELDKLRHQVKEKVEASRSAYRQKQTVRFSQYAPGDFVMVSNLNRKVGVSPKLSDKWIGPFEVLQLKSEVTYRIKEIDGRRRSLIVHHDRLRPCPVRPDRLLSEDSSPADSGSPAPTRPAPAPAPTQRTDETRPTSFMDLTVEEPQDLTLSDESRSPPAAEAAPAEEPAEPETCSPPQLDRYPRRSTRPPQWLTYETM